MATLFSGGFVGTIPTELTLLTDLITLRLGTCLDKIPGVIFFDDFGQLIYGENSHRD